MLMLTANPRRVTRCLALAVIAMTAASVLAQWVRLRSTSEPIRAVASIFKLSAEGTIPAFFSAAALLASAALLWVNARAAAQDGRPFVRHWRWLAIVFLYLSIDEAVSIHELAIDPMRRLLGDTAHGVLHFAWVVPGMAVVLAMGLTYLRFLLHLPRRVRIGVAVAGVMYVGGALGMEMLGGYVAERTGTETIPYALIALVEEFMEMMGVVLFIDALLAHLGTCTGELRVALAGARVASPLAGRAPG
ncbi:MAG: hypothetical protein WBD40_15530, partial [Tepidisphaeraceae bacterium]